MTFRVDGINGSKRTDDSGDGSDDNPQPDETGEALSWILSVLGGIAAMLGVMIVVL